MMAKWLFQPGQTRIKLPAVLLAVALCFSLVFPSASSASAISPFITHPSGISLGDISMVSDAWVIRDEDEGVYKMWFTHLRTDIEQSGVAGLIAQLDLQGMLAALKDKDIDALINYVSVLDPDVVYDLVKGSTTVIGYATSSNGIDWTVADAQVIAADNELQAVAAPCVIKIDGTYHMWYSRNTTSYSRAELEQILANLREPTTRADAITTLLENNHAALDHATSTDGLNWDIPATDVLPNAGVYLGDSVGTPSVIYDGTTYQMWFSNVSTGLEEADIQYIVNNIEDITPAYLLDLQNQATASIGYATSADGDTWTVVDRAVFSSGSGAYGAVAMPCVVGNATDGYEMWYSYGVSDFTSEEIDPVLDELEPLASAHLDNLLQLLQDEDYDGLITLLSDIIDNQIPLTRATAEGNTCNIGYATSADGTSWSIEDPYALTGASVTPWASVGRPCVIKNGSIYEIWYTKGLDELSGQALVDLWRGEISTIGYGSNGVILDLVSGWNLVGLPLDPMDPATEEVVAQILADVRTIWTYDATTGLWDYFTTIPGAPQGALTEMEPGAGYWIEIIDPVSLLLFGPEPAYPFEIELVTGWNLVSIPKTPLNSATEQVLSGIMDNVRTVWTYDATTGLWDYFTTIPGAPQGGLVEMVEKRAYWIEMTSGDTLVIS